MIGRMLETAFIKSFDGINDLFRKTDKGPIDSPGLLLLGKGTPPYHPERLEDAFIDTEWRLKHVYILGSTGSGKTKLIQAFIQQDALAGNGLALIDAHGDLTQSVLSFLARNFSGPEELADRLILIEPFNREWSIGFNPIQMTDQPFSAMLELVEIFRRFWGNGYWGPRMEEVLRNTLITLSENSLTLLEARALLTNEDFREGLVEKVSFGEVRDYWNYRYNSLSDRMQAVYREPVLNKISAFITDPAIYRILGQRESTVNLRAAMDQGKWVLLNLSKGQLKENMRLLGTLFLAKFKQAALSRIDTPEDHRQPFFMFIDEFQNFISEDLEGMLSEARKFRLGLTLAHQNLDQLPRVLISVILGNVGTEIFFRLSHQDASRISTEMEPKERAVIERKLIDFKVGQAYLKIKGHQPSLLKTTYVPPVSASNNVIQEIKIASFQYWARPVAQVEREIEERRNLWANNGARVRRRLRNSKVKTLEDYTPFLPEGLFEEGQSEW